MGSQGLASTRRGDGTEDLSIWTISMMGREDPDPGCGVTEAAPSTEEDTMLAGKKTYIVMIVGLVTVAGAFMQGQVDLAEAINQALILLGIGGIRAGVAGQ
jgi:hypothetical protein